MSIATIKNPFGQRLMTKEIAAKLPSLYSQDGKGYGAIAYVKYFCGSFTWYVTEMDQESGLFFSLCYSHMAPSGELGYSSLEELAETRASGFLVVERDRSFRPTPLGDCKP